MFGTEAADGNGFQTSYASVILYGHTGKAFYGFRQVLHTEPFDPGLVHHLERRALAGGGRAYLSQHLDTRKLVIGRRVYLRIQSGKRK